MTNHNTSVLGVTNLSARASTTTCKAPRVGHRIAKLETHLKKLQDVNCKKLEDTNRHGSALTAYVDAMLSDLRISRPATAERSKEEVVAPQPAARRLVSATSTSPVIATAVSSARVTNTSRPENKGSARYPLVQQRAQTARTSATQFGLVQPMSARLGQAPVATTASGLSTPRQVSMQSSASAVTRIESVRSTSHWQSFAAGSPRDMQPNPSEHSSRSLNSLWANADAKTGQKRPPTNKIRWAGSRHRSLGPDNVLMECQNLQTGRTTPTNCRSPSPRRQGPARSASVDGVRNRRQVSSAASRQSSSSTCPPAKIPSMPQSTGSSTCLPESLTALWQSQSTSNACAPSSLTLSSSTKSVGKFAQQRSFSVPTQPFPGSFSVPTQPFPGSPNALQNSVSFSTQSYTVKNSACSARLSSRSRPASAAGSFVAPATVPAIRASSMRFSSSTGAIQTPTSSYVAPAPMQMSGSMRLSSSTSTLPRQCSARVTSGSLTGPPGASFSAAAPAGTSQASLASFNIPIALGASFQGSASNHIGLKTKGFKGKLNASEFVFKAEPQNELAPVQAFKFKADCSDMMDMTMSWTLCKLDSKAAADLWLRRLAPGKYEIDGRRVTVVWVEGRKKKSELAASEDDIPGSVPMPLLDYLNQAASVACFMRNQRPQHPKVQPGWDTSEYELADPDRVTSMLFACKAAGVNIQPRPPSVSSED